MNSLSISEAAGPETSTHIGMDKRTKKERKTVGQRVEPTHWVDHTTQLPHSFIPFLV